MLRCAYSCSPRIRRSAAMLFSCSGAVRGPLPFVANRAASIYEKRYSILLVCMLFKFYLSVKSFHTCHTMSRKSFFRYLSGHCLSSYWSLRAPLHLSASTSGSSTMPKRAAKHRNEGAWPVPCNGNKAVSVPSCHIKFAASSRDHMKPTTSFSRI